MTLREVYDKMSQEDQGAFWIHLNKVLLWRGWDRGSRAGDRPSRSYQDVESLADLFEKNGCAMEEYT